MRLTQEEAAMHAGELGPAVQWAIDHQIKVGRYLGAKDFVPVNQAHIMADTESLGVAGVEWLERLAKLPAEQRRVRIPTITDPRGTDFAAAARLRQEPWMLDLERRAIAAFEALGVLMTDTCINYQTIMPPVRGEHCAYGDTGVVIYSNSVCGARSNFEGGPSALSAGLTGRTPRYGYHLDERRQANLVVDVAWTPRELNEWGALGGIVGRLAGDYWRVPALTGIDRVPTSDEMKHFGAALASYGSVALFHMAGITPRYGYHLDERRQATLVVDVAWTPRELNEWGALGGIVGRLAGDYWRVPALTGIDRVPTSDEMKHFGAALASYGSVALFHMAGITPEAQRLDDIMPAGLDVDRHRIVEADIRAFVASYAAGIDKVDLVVFSAPQLSLIEMQQLADLLDGRRASIPLLAVTSPQVKPDADRMGLSERIERAGGTVLAGMCFYQSYAREMAEANGWKALATNSAKLTNILGGYGYRPMLMSMDACVDVACAGGKVTS